MTIEIWMLDEFTDSKSVHSELLVNKKYQERVHLELMKHKQIQKMFIYLVTNFVYFRSYKIPL